MNKCPHPLKKKKHSSRRRGWGKEEWENK